MVTRNHALGCGCWRCRTQALGDWLDKLGGQTDPGKWQNFATITYATHSYPWARGFPNSGSGRPSSDFAGHFFAFFVSHLEAQLGSRLDYVVADQFGTLNGRFHQHALLAAKGMEHQPRREIEEWLRNHAGYARLLPFEHGAAHYLVRFLGRDIEGAEWDLRVGNRESGWSEQSKTGQRLVATSAELPRSFFHQTMPRRHR